MRIVLVHPRGFNWFPGQRDMTDVANRMVPQGILSIAAYLLKQGHDVFIYDCLGPGVPIQREAQVRAILKYEPQMVGFSATTSSFLDAAEMAQEIKKCVAHVKTVCGGVHVSALQDQLLLAYPAFDFLCAGDGELTMAALSRSVAPA